MTLRIAVSTLTPLRHNIALPGKKSPATFETVTFLDKKRVFQLLSDCPSLTPAGTLRFRNVTLNFVILVAQEYIIRVQRGVSSENSWQVNRMPKCKKKTKNNQIKYVSARQM